MEDPMRDVDLKTLTNSQWDQKRAQYLQYVAQVENNDKLKAQSDFNNLSPEEKANYDRLKNPYRNLSDAEFEKVRRNYVNSLRG